MRKVATMYLRLSKLEVTSVISSNFTLDPPLAIFCRHNRIWSGRAAGIAVTEEGKGHILYNDIYGMEWGGVDIRNGGNPVVTNNWIRDGHADGIVIGEGGKGVIMDNDIRGKCGLI